MIHNYTFKSKFLPQMHNLICFSDHFHLFCKLIVLFFLSTFFYQPYSILCWPFSVWDTSSFPLPSFPLPSFPLPSFPSSHRSCCLFPIVRHSPILRILLFSSLLFFSHSFFLPNTENVLVKRVQEWDELCPVVFVQPTRHQRHLIDHFGDVVFLFTGFRLVIFAVVIEARFCTCSDWRCRSQLLSPGDQTTLLVCTWQKILARWGSENKTGDVNRKKGRWYQKKGPNCRMWQWSDELWKKKPNEIYF